MFADGEIQVAISSCGRERDPVSIALMGLDLDLVRANILNSIAPATLASYSSAWVLWLAHLGLLGEHRSAFSEHLVLSFFNGLMAKGLSWSQVKTLAGV